jgi:hypothetical protein
MTRNYNILGMINDRDDKDDKDDDWTFADTNTNLMTHGIHPYPARMIPQVAERLISKFASSERRDNDLCIDPFCGSGTVLVESKLKGINSIGVDNNPLAVLISQVKTTPIPRSELESEWSHLFRLLQRDISNSSRDVEIPPIKNLDYWFKPSVSNQLSIIKDKIMNEIRDHNEDEAVANFFKVCFSATIRKASNIRQGEFKLYRLPKEKLKAYSPSVIKIFSDIVKANIQRMNIFDRVVDKSVESHVVKGDTRKLLSLDPSKIQDGCATLLITSPPYGDSHTTVAYGQFSRYSSAWLGYSENEVWNVDKVGLGGITFKEVEDLESPTLSEMIDQIQKIDVHRAKELYSFFKDMDLCFSQISKIMKKGTSHICFVLGNRTVKRIKIKADKILIELGNKHGFKYYNTYQRDIPNKTMPSMNAPENTAAMKGETISKENILIWKY